MEREHRALERAHRFGRRHIGEHDAKPFDRPRVQLRDARLVDANLGADLLHRDVAIVVKRNDLLLAGRQRPDRGAHLVLHFAALVGGVRCLGLGRHQRSRQTRFVDGLAGGERRRGFDGVDADDGAAQALFVGADLRGQVRKRRFVAQLAAQRLARRLELASHAANAPRPRVTAKRVDHRASNAPFGEGLKLDASCLVESMGGVDQSDHAVLNKVSHVNRVGHRRRHAACESFHEGQSVNDATALSGRHWLGAHFVFGS